MSATPPHADLLREISAFCAREGVSKSEFGRRATGDMSLVADLAKGRECRSRTVQRIRAVLDAPSDARAAS